MSERPLLCELHAHSTWSDGDLSISELVDLYGSHQFDVLCITDHVGRGGEWHDPRWRITGPDASRRVPRGDRARSLAGRGRVRAAPHPRARADLRRPRPRRGGTRRRRRAPHARLSRRRPRAGTHRGAGCRRGTDRRTPLRARGEATSAPVRATARWAVAGHSLSGLVDRYELVNRRDVFSWVAEAGLPGVATGDFHRPEHLLTWKTLLPCAAGEGPVVRYLRSALPAYLVDLAEPARIQAA